MNRTQMLSLASRVLNAGILAMVTAIGVAAFLYPFFQPQPSLGFAAHGQDALLVFVAIITLSLGAVLSNMVSTGGGLNAKMVAVLGILTSVNAVLRAVPGPMGFSATFALPIIAGYCYGSTFGYLLGALSLAVSAILGAGIGPWLPYQMFTIGWVGLSSGWLANLRRIGFVRDHPALEVIVLSTWGLCWGIGFGFVMNVWFWPFVFDPTQAGLYWERGIGAVETFKRYMAFYALTSLWWDAGRAAGNVLLIALFGAPMLRLLRRFGRRFTFRLGDAPTI